MADREPSRRSAPDAALASGHANPTEPPLSGTYTTAAITRHVATAHRCGRRINRSERDVWPRKDNNQMTGREFSRRFRRLILSGFISVLATGCTNPLGTPPESTTASRDGQPAFVGTVWISTDAATPPGTADLSARRHNGDGFVRGDLPARSMGVYRSGPYHVAGRWSPD